MQGAVVRAFAQCPYLADVSDVFFKCFLFSFGAGKGGRVQGEKGGVLLFGNRESGGVFEERRWGGAHRRWEGVARGGGA